MKYTVVNPMIISPLLLSKKNQNITCRIISITYIYKWFVPYRYESISKPKTIPIVIIDENTIKQTQFQKLIKIHIRKRDRYFFLELSIIEFLLHKSTCTKI